MILLKCIMKIKSSYEKKFMMKHFIVFVIKIRLRNYTYVPYYVLLFFFIWKENEIFLFEKFISYLRAIWIVWRLFDQSWHIHKLFVLHAFLLKAHGALKPYWASQLTLLYFSAQVLPRSSKSMRGGKDSVFSRFVRM